MRGGALPHVNLRFPWKPQSLAHLARTAGRPPSPRPSIQCVSCGPGPTPEGRARGGWASRQPARPWWRQLDVAQGASAWKSARRRWRRRSLRASVQYAGKCPPPLSLSRLWIDSVRHLSALRGYLLSEEQPRLRGGHQSHGTNERIQFSSLLTLLNTEYDVQASAPQLVTPISSKPPPNLARMSGPPLSPWHVPTLPFEAPAQSSSDFRCRMAPTSAPSQAEADRIVSDTRCRMVDSCSSSEGPVWPQPAAMPVPELELEFRDNPEAA